MAEIIDTDLKVVLGQLIRVKNLQKKPNENAVYVAVQVEDENGNNERCLLFTEIECSDMQNIYSAILEKMLYGRLYKFILDNKETFVVRVKNKDLKDRYLRISKTQLSKAEKRALNNKQDLTKKAMFVDMFD